MSRNLSMIKRSRDIYYIKQYMKLSIILFLLPEFQHLYKFLIQNCVGAHHLLFISP